MPDSRESVKTIFGKVLEIQSDDERSKYLDQACAGDVSLRAELDDLLGAIERAGNFLGDSPPADATIDQPITEKPGETIGPYKLLQQIGEGGMGVVFMAEQIEPLQRTVALKIIKPGMDTRQVIARFEAERQAVAMMDHPNIAKVLDAGTTNSGRPYFVMELVKGVPITRYCDEKHLPLPARLELFVQVCQAVQHAHQKDIIHRDIKPNNVLVAEYDNRAVPKVIDFGVAKATSQRLTERTMFTEFGQVLGTMEYMSPEQSKFNQLDIDTRSDIYSLGVLLYELLLELAERVHRHTAAWSTGLVDWHNVNIAQGFREPATFAMQSQSPADRKATYDNFASIRRLYGQFPGGMFGGDENCRPGYTDPRQAIETCGMVEMMFSAETLAWITGDPIWADRCEDVAYNSLPAALTADLKALRYLTAPNMPLSDKQPKNPGLQNGGPMLLMSPHNHRCCQHNWGQGWPYFAQHQWYATSDHGLAAMFYNSCNVDAKVADGRTAKIAVETHHPFDETVRIRVVDLGHPLGGCEFPIYLRIPGWCHSPRIKVNDEAVDVEAKPVSFVRLQRTWQSGDEIEVLLPMDVEIKRWPENKNSVSVKRGPITFSLRIGEEYRRAGGTERWPEWEIVPTAVWNYGLAISEKNPAASFELTKREWPADDQPFTLEGTPLELRAQAKRIPDWKLDQQGLVDLLPLGPVRSAEPVETVTLVPMGAARLRISAFPVIGEQRIP